MKADAWATFSKVQKCSSNTELNSTYMYTYSTSPRNKGLNHSFEIFNRLQI